MLTLQLGTSNVHALAFSPDSARLAVAAGRKLAVVDWRASGEPVWQEPPPYTRGSATTLSFDPVNPDAGDAEGLLAGYQRHTFHFGTSVEVVSPHYPYGLTGVVWERRGMIVADSPCPRVVLHLGRPSGDPSEYLFALPFGGGTPTARLGKRNAGGPWPPGRHGDLPHAAWADKRDRLLVWSTGFLRWYRWPPPPVPPLKRWQVLLASVLSGPNPPPPDAELLAEYPFPLIADAVAPLPDGDTVLVASKGAIARWHAPTGTELARWRWPGMQALRSLAVSPDGTVAAVGGNGGRVVVWDLDA